MVIQHEAKKQPLKMTGTVAHGYSSESTKQELSNEYQQDRVNYDGFQNSLRTWTLDKSSRRFMVSMQLNPNTTHTLNRWTFSLKWQAAVVIRPPTMRENGWELNNQYAFKQLLRYTIS